MATVGEPCYFPKEGKEVKGEVEGYVVVQVQRLDSKKTEFYVLDANNLPGGPIAVIETGKQTRRKFKRPSMAGQTIFFPTYSPYLQEC